MKTIKNKLFLATAILALASCADNTYIGDQEPTVGGGAISFNMGTPALTRATDNHTPLNNEFVVYGYKTISSTDYTVFDNYVVKWTTNTAGTTTSNSADWEYVGYNSKATTPVIQSIKYWDTNATSYNFFGYSLGTGTGGNNPSHATASVMTNSTYTLTGTQDQLATCYISKKENISAPSNASVVQLDFVSLMAKIQLGFFETIPGYSVKDLKFYTTASASTSATAPALYDAGQTASLPKEGTYTVTFDNDGNPILTWAANQTNGTQANILFTQISNDEFKVREYKETASTTDKLYIGRASNEATKTEAKPVLPNPNGTALTLKVDYTLVSRDGTGETINVTGKTAVVPAQYTQWKPNFAYTYLFKITDEDLTPITLDAVILTTDQGNQETITTVDNPSITTYQKGAIVNEYSAGNIYVVVGEGTALTVGTNAKLYTAATTGSYTGGITEASVANALKNGTMNNNTTPTTWTVTDASSNTLTISSAAGLTAFTEIPNTDSPTGVALTINGAIFSATANTTYVFEYIIPTYTQASGTYVTNTKYYTDNTGTTEVDTSGFTAGTTDVSSYFVANYSTPASKHYKVIKVAASN